jgi:murein DD-endopeptidase MepM/ murein hydrolase activator NlpD
MMMCFGRLALSALCLMSLAACIPAPAPHNASIPPIRIDQAATAGLLHGDQVTGGDANPTWALQPVMTSARTVTAGVYTVQQGDTLRAIGIKMGAGSDAIAIENGLTPPYILTVGQTLRIPGGQFHSVAAGETGIGIAHAYATDWSRIATLNALTEPYILRIGQRLKLPNDARSIADAGTNSSVDIAARAARFTLDIDDIVTGSQPALAPRGLPSAGTTAPTRPVTTAIAPPTSFNGRFQWPLTGPIISRFGPLAPGKVSDGVNIAAATGTPIHAAADGVVAYAGDEISVYGGLILINHGGGWISAYGHAGKLNVQRGQATKAGDVIGLAGASGQVQTPQLHFQLRKDRVPVDPLSKLPAR